MTVCEICGKAVDRRQRLADGHLVCWDCADVFTKPPEQVCEKVKWLRELRDKAQQELNRIKSMAYYGSPFSVVPHRHHIKKAIQILEEKKVYQPFYDYLSETYHIEAPVCSVNHNRVSNVSQKALACYFPMERAIISKEKTMSYHTAFHEFFHHLEHQGIAVMELEKEDRERNANLFAEACLKSI